MSALRSALRQFRHQPLFAVVTMLVIGLGAGAATTIFTIVDSVVLRPLPYREPDRLVTIWDTNAGQALSHDLISPVNFMDQRDLPVFEDAAAWWRPGVNLTDPGLDPLRVSTIETSANLFDVLGVSPQIGAGFPADVLFARNEPMAIISDRLWRARYGADPSIVGQQLRFNSAPTTIAGVMPPGFHYPDDVDVWVRLSWDMTQHSRDAHFMEAVARLSEGTTIDQAQAAIDALWLRIEAEFAGTNNSPGRGWGSRVIPLLNEQLGYYRPALFVLFGAVGLLLLIGMLNVASLLLTRALTRERDVAVRMAMGAAPRHLVAQLLGEGLVLAAGGALLGVIVSAVVLPLLVAVTPVEIPRLEEAAVSWRALGLSVGVAGVATVIFALVPALVLLRGQLMTDLRSGERGSSRGSRRIYSVLVAAEVALACALLVSSALLVRTVRQMTLTPIGVQADDTVTATVQLIRSQNMGDGPQGEWSTIADTHSRILDVIRAQPGVVAAGASNFLPLEIGWRVSFGVRGHPAPVSPTDAPQAQLHSVSEGYFEAMGATRRAGRTFTALDGRDSPAVVVVNAEFARRHLTGTPAVGQVVNIMATNIGPLGMNLMVGSPPSHSGVPFEVVGVVDDIRNVPLGQTIEPAFYVPTRQFPFTDVFVAVKARDTATAVAAIRTALDTAAPEVPMGAARTWGDRFSEGTAEPRLLMTVLLLFGGLAMLLAALGVYGIFSWSVASRARELAIRLTLGARPAGVGALVLRQSVALAVAGLVAGLLIVRVAAGVLTRVLYDVSPTDGASTAAAGTLLLAAAVIACVPPALRAMRVDPVQGLRSE